jgi:sterol desaturase/sphingolipid hydroxylase (fatty acid hydroxylase superfamily)
LRAVHALRSLTRWFTFPVVLFGALGATAAALGAGISAGWVVGWVTLASAVLILAVQQFAPFDVRWRGTSEDVRVDLMHGLFSTAGANMVFEATVLGAVAAGAAALSAALGGTLWPTALPLSVQLLMAVVIGDFGAYWVHRLAHETPMLWRIHALHHTSERLYMLSAGRNHPFNAVLTYAVQTVPLVLLGAPPAILALLSVAIGVHGLLQHANIDMALRGWSWIFSTADLHRRHHSTVLAVSDANYGSTLILWDLVFGTRVAGAPPDHVGIEGVPTPSGYREQLGLPFTIALD